MRPLKQKASDVEVAIIDYIIAQGGKAYKINVGPIPIDYKKMIFRKNPMKGFCDILGCWQGLLLWIEVKVPPDTESEDQEKKRVAMEEADGICLIAKDAGCVIDYFETCLLPMKAELQRLVEMRGI